MRESACKQGSNVPVTFNGNRYSVGEKISFLCNGRGRGGHYRVFAVITKCNRKTVDAVEAPTSYKPGMLWRVSYNEIDRTYDSSDKYFYGEKVMT